MPNQSIKMLVADDARPIHQVFRQVAARATGGPIQFIAAENGRDCRKLLEAGDVDIAFIDVNMPEMSGPDALFAAQAKCAKTFVTLMSGDASTPNLELARSLNAYEFLTKPFTAADVEAIVGIYRRVSAPMRALIVDDSTTTRRVIQKVLNASIFNMRIEEAGDGNAALAACDGAGYDVIFLDCNMPGVNGMQVLERLMERKAKPRVIMVSAERNEQREQRAIGRGATAFLHKPFFPADIDRVLHGAFNLKMPGLAGAPSPSIVPAMAPRADRASA
jgi:CheY-like chemotaxis protein